MMAKYRMLLAMLAIGCASSGALAEAGNANPGELYRVSIGRAGGTPLVAVNGGPGFDHRYMIAAPIWTGMAERRRIVFYDQRATGRSPDAAAKDLTVQRMVDDLEAIRRSLNAEKIDLVGHSWGGILSMAYAVRYPDRVSHLILVGSGDAKPAANEYLFDKLYPEIVATIPPDPSPAGQMGCVEIDAYDRMSYYDQRNNVAVAGEAPKFSQETCTAVMLDAIKLDLYPALVRLKVPTLVINGRFDANVAPSVAYRISKAIPGARLEYFERSGHSPFVEEPEKFALVVERFLADKAD
ncbi:MAG: alpha/beta fold hydrolase [Sphingosinicella sp.]|nr:alpha/beta fold hydrolase [Sphingosinicella sp.]